MKVSALLKKASLELEGAGVEWGESEAEKLLALALGKSAGEVLVWRALDLELSEVAGKAEISRFLFLLSKRRQRIPLQHLEGSAPFGGLELKAGPGVFVPRPETEAMAEAAASFVSSRPSPVMADLCAGTGAVGLEVCRRQKCLCFEVEKMPKPFRFLQENIASCRKKLHPGSECVPVRGNTLSPSLLPFLSGRADCVASNPPYLALPAPKQPEAAKDPPEALFGGGPDGLSFIRRLLPVCTRLLKRGGLCIIEHESGQSGEVCALFARFGFEDVETVADLSGRDRFTRGIKWLR
ncbi:MAG: peptide chain release factor N(5)-glutamine methyltransferase [Aeriscardovia sp.]|nr:peptide chain release factor N(5)-glutamine methyltransferase [Aeriscardovia sp.]